MWPWGTIRRLREESKLILMENASLFSENFLAKVQINQLRALLANHRGAA